MHRAARKFAVVWLFASVRPYMILEVGSCVGDIRAFSPCAGKRMLLAAMRRDMHLQKSRATIFVHAAFKATNVRHFLRVRHLVTLYFRSF